MENKLTAIELKNLHTEEIEEPSTTPKSYDGIFFHYSYRRFEQSVRREARYIYKAEVRDFLAAVVETSQKRKNSIEKATILWRAQKGYTWRTQNAGTEEEFEVPDAFDPERMVPKAKFVGDGRVNPRGIPCLYLASTEQTAMAEVRPGSDLLSHWRNSKSCETCWSWTAQRTRNFFRTGSYTQPHMR